MTTGIAAAAVGACILPIQEAGARVLPGNHAGDGKWDDSWTTKLGRHRTVFDVASLEADPGVDQVADVMDAFHEVLGTSDPDLGFVLVIRHRAVPLFMSDVIWAKYDLGKDMKEKDPETSAAWTHNPARATLEKLQKRGVIMLGCNRAVTGFIGRMAKHTKTSEDDVKREVMEGIMAGVILQPNGLYALARAQDVGCGVMR